VSQYKLRAVVQKQKFRKNLVASELRLEHRLRWIDIPITDTTKVNRLDVVLELHPSIVKLYVVSASVAAVNRFGSKLLSHRTCKN
jgi:hypothetical protein